LKSDPAVVQLPESKVPWIRDEGAKAEPLMDAWLKTHAAFEVPLGQAVHAAGDRDALAGDRDAIRRMIHVMRRNLETMRTPTVPRALTLLRSGPEGILVRLFRPFLRSRTPQHRYPAVSAELDRLD
jgi:2-dehydropantoate 2-reductase